MPRHQAPAQRETVERVMHEFKRGELKTARGKQKVRNPKQAIAIALHEAGASREESEVENKRNLRRTKRKERRGESQSARGAKGREKTRAELYAEARKRNVSGRSKMNKQQLADALRGR